MPQQEKKEEYTQVLLEEVRGHYKALAEALDGVAQKTNKIDGLEDKSEKVHTKVDSLGVQFKKLDGRVGVLDNKVDKLDGRVGVLDNKVDKLDGRVGVLDNKVDKLSDDMDFVKGELRVIRNELKEKVGRDEFQLLEERVIRLEKSSIH
jgi:chromosome segregation ATPase